MIDLGKIICKHDVRPYCRAPLRLADGRVVATCGVKLVCVDRFDGDASALMAAPEKVDATICKLLSGHENAKQWIPVASLVIPELDPCTHCGGLGYVAVSECGDCDGAGDFDHGHHVYTCKECDGEGETDIRPCGQDDPEGRECFRCSGSGRKAIPITVPGLIGAWGASSAELSKFPEGAEISPMALGDSELLALRGDGWIGVLSPMSAQF